MQENKPIIIELDLKKLAKDNLLATIILSLSFIILHFVINGGLSISVSPLSLIISTLLFILLYVILIVLHEAFHLIGFIIFGGVHYSSLKYGLNLKMGVAYATTEQPLSNRAMKLALLLPFWTTGVTPTILGFYFNSMMLLILGAFLIAGAVGDFAMYRELKKFPPDVLVKDDPELPRLYVYIK